MTDDLDNQDTEKTDNRMMWIVTAVIVLVLVGGMGINYFMHSDASGGSTDTPNHSTMLPLK